MESRRCRSRTTSSSSSETARKGFLSGHFDPSTRGSTGSEDPGELRRLGAALLEQRHCGHDANELRRLPQSPTQINVYSYSFWKSTQLKYFVDQKRLTVEDRRFRWDHFLTGMHARGGFDQEGMLQRPGASSSISSVWRSSCGSRRALHVVGSAGFPPLGSHRARCRDVIVPCFHAGIVSRA